MITDTDTSAHTLSLSWPNFVGSISVTLSCPVQNRNKEDVPIEYTVEMCDLYYHRVFQTQW